MRRALVLIAACAALLAGCSGAATPTIPAGPPTTATTAATPTGFGNSQPNERNNIVKAIGQPAAVTSDGAVAAEFRVDAIRPGAKCASQELNVPPENGQFLAVDVYIKTNAKFAGGDPNMLTGDQSWSVVTADGLRHASSSYPVYACSPSSMKNISNLRAGVTAQGTVYVDAPKDLAGAVLVLNLVTMDGGWEWPIPAA